MYIMKKDFEASELLREVETDDGKRIVAQV